LKPRCSLTGTQAHALPLVRPRGWMPAPTASEGTAIAGSNPRGDFASGNNGDATPRVQDAKAAVPARRRCGQRAMCRRRQVEPRGTCGGNCTHHRALIFCGRGPSFGDRNILKSYGREPVHPASSARRQVCSEWYLLGSTASHCQESRSLLHNPLRDWSVARGLSMADSPSYPMNSYADS
jgi:hypothetical protein